MVSYRTDIVSSPTRRGTTSVPLALSHVADFYRRYPGEAVTFYTRIDVHEDMPNFTVRIMLASGLVLKEYRTAPEQLSGLPQIYEEVDGTFLVWQQHDVTAGTRFEYTVDATVAHTKWDVTLDSRARVVTHKADEGTGMTEESISVMVRAKGSYLQFLPALYDQDEFMGRFLMLFESFWKPADQQIDNIHYYFDPRLAPVDLLPWIASWLDLMLDERWPEERQRKLLIRAAELFRKRGTKQGLEEYLEIYTGYKPQIIEHRANNFLVGKEAKLGPAIALGKRNTPHTFTVVMHLPPIVEEDATQRAYKEQERRHSIERIIEAEKPAHTAFLLLIEDKSSAVAGKRNSDPIPRASTRPT